MPTPEQTLQTLANLHPDYPTFAKSLPNELTHTTKPLPQGLATDVLTLVKRESPELSKFLDMQQDTHQPSKFFPGATTVLPLVAILFLLRSHIKLELPNFTLEHKPMGDDLFKKIIDTLNKYMGSK